MKHLYLLSIILLSTILLSAQTRFSAPGAKWCIGSSSISGYHSNNPIVARDSTIDNIPCSYIPYFGCMYVRNDTVYNIQYDNGTTEFLYDYGAQEGDIWIVRVESGAYPYAQFKVDTLREFVFGDTLKLFRLLPDPNAPTSLNCNYCHWGDILEGVGSVSTYFIPGPWGLIDFDNPSFECYSDSARGAIKNGSSLQQTDSCSCRFTTAINELEDGQVSILHSLSQHAINISFLKNTKANIMLYNMQGQQLRMDDIHASSHSINTNSLAAGVYLCTVIVEGYKPYIKKIVVQR